MKDYKCLSYLHNSVHCACARASIGLALLLFYICVYQCNLTPTILACLRLYPNIFSLVYMITMFSTYTLLLEMCRV
uniref:Uncharacterized protein n=1 Tax=Octopus bimaculoides TaxID=37653 RepID=A0A0L8FNZ3_OCTBM